MSEKVFLSHSNQDVVLTRLIGQILEDRGLKCFYSERDISVGREFDGEIRGRIHSCEVFLVIWTAHAAVSAWVNQEIGCAIAEGIPVWPLAIDDSTIKGIIARRQGSPLCQVTDAHAAIVSLADEIKKASHDRPFAPHVDSYVKGKEERAREIVNILREESSRQMSPYTLRMRAGFSCFAISDESAYRIPGYHTVDWHNLLIQEREEAERMLKWATLRMIIWPQRPYEDAYMQMRFRNLLKFLRSNNDFERVRVALGLYRGGNLYIFDRNLSVAFDRSVSVVGEKGPGSILHGYEFTTITRHGPTVAASIDEFDSQFNEIWKSHVKDCHTSDLRQIRTHVIKLLEGMAPVGAQS